MFSPARRRARGRRAERAAALSRHRARADVAPRISRRCSATARALAQRNAALRERGARPRRRAEQRVAVWEPPLAEHGAVLWRERVALGREQAAGRFARAVRGHRRAGAGRACATRRRSSRRPWSVQRSRDALARGARAEARHSTCGAGSRTPARTATTSTLTLDGARAARVRLGRPAAHGGDRAAAARGRDAARARAARRRSSCSTIRSPSSTRAARRASSSCSPSSGMGQTLLDRAARERHPAGAHDARALAHRGGRRHARRRARGCRVSARKKPSALGDVLAGVLRDSGIAERVEQAAVDPRVADARRAADRGGDRADCRSRADGTLFVRGDDECVDDRAVADGARAAAGAERARRAGAPIRRIRWLLQRD